MTERANADIPEDNLITRYIRYRAYLGENRSQALRHLNGRAGLAIQGSHFYEMEQGRRHLPWTAQRAILEELAPDIVESLTGPTGLRWTARQRERLARALLPPRFRGRSKRRG